MFIRHLRVLSFISSVDQLPRCMWELSACAFDWGTGGLVFFPSGDIRGGLQVHTFAVAAPSDMDVVAIFQNALGVAWAKRYVHELFRG